MSPPIGAAEKGLGARLAADDELAGLLGRDDAGEVRAYNGWPHDVLERPAAPDFPRVTFFAPTGQAIRPGIGRIQVQLDEWVWPEGDRGGKAHLDAIDARILALVDEAWWVHDGHRLSAVTGDPQGFPSGPGRPLRRMRPIGILVSPA